ncbi:DHH family phosphoesterase [Candidatus Micrarchaeota archaeon]|nr:DHH family phosphoesterase [Candidatus Micrarchaeota archaeon]
MQDNKKRFLALLEEYKDKKIVVAGHRNADIDAVCSAYVLSKRFPNSIISFPEKMDEGGKKLSKKLGLKWFKLEELKKEEFEGLVVVDITSYTLLEGGKGWNVVGLIDHHHRPEKNKIEAIYEIVDADCPSTAEILAELIGVENLDSDDAFALACGFISDTARFKNGKTRTFELLAQLLRKAGREYLEVLEFGEHEPSIDVKLKIMDGFKRARTIVYSGVLIATSVCESNESSVSSALVDVADAAFVAKWVADEKETRVSSRLKKHLDVPLNDIMREAAESFGGNGGGHPKAAGGSAKVEPSVMLEKCVEIFCSKLD